MPKIDLCFLWHMHQPFYKDLASGDFRLPWARLHALKDYYGMVKILDEFPGIHQTFNLAPSLLTQIEEYASGAATDPFLQLALKPAEELQPSEKEFILRYFFQATEERLIGRYPRYAELFRTMQQSEHNPRRAASSFDTQMLRDLQILSQLAWFDEEYVRHDKQIRDLTRKGRNFGREDQAVMGRKQLEALRKVLPVYREFADRGQIELSTSPFYHPILPLLCDSNIAAVSHPYVSLPPQFSYPEDAREQLQRSYSYFEEKVGKAPRGLWPSEGSVSDETLRIASQVGFAWTASDDGILARTLNAPVKASNTYCPYVWRSGGEQIHVLFRDHRLSDLIGFVYSHMDASDAAEHFLKEVHKNCEPILKSGRDALVPIILDGENAWEYYFENGRPFLRELYSRISSDADVNALTISEATGAAPARELTHIFPGSWIDANFDIWIGAEEDNMAWEHLLEARKTYDRVIGSARAASISDEDKRAAREEILIAEGSDWCWWYGPEHTSANGPEFDQLYRNHLASAYRLLGEDVPPGLGGPFSKAGHGGLHEAPTGLIQPTIDGLLSSQAEWSGAGCYRIDYRSGAMHSRSLIQGLHYGSDGRNIYLRLDLTEPAISEAALAFRFRLRNPAGEQFHIHLSQSNPGGMVRDSNLADSAVTVMASTILEMRISMTALHIRRGEALFLQLSVIRDGLPAASLPISGELELQSSPMAAYAF